MRLIFMGTPEFAVPSLRRLIDDGHVMAAVFTQPDKPAGRGNRVHEPPIKALAAAYNIPCFQPSKIKTNEEVRNIFQAANPDACIVAAYGKLLPPWLLEIPRLGCINVHASVLPKYRGAAPINWAIARGETVTGITIMQMDAGMDTGAIWSQRSTAIRPEETAPELSARLSQIGAELLAETLPAIAGLQAHPVPQNAAEATYAPILKREDGLIDFSLPAKMIGGRVRGFQPWPGSYTKFRGGRLIVWRARDIEDSNADTASASGELLVGTEAAAHEQPPQSDQPTSTIIALDKDGFRVLCGEGTALHIEELQIEGKKRVTARDFLNGTRLSIGDQINQ
jgi:methionyl-tRNA formyltransferase